MPRTDRVGAGSNVNCKKIRLGGSSWTLAAYLLCNLGPRALCLVKSGALAHQMEDIANIDELLQSLQHKSISILALPTAVSGMEPAPSAGSTTALPFRHCPARRVDGFFLCPLLWMHGGGEKTATGRSGSRTIFSTSHSVAWRFTFVSSAASPESSTTESPTFSWPAGK